MLKSWFGPKPHVAAGRKLHAFAVEAGRRPHFYAELGVPDTPDGRFELIVLHAALVMRHLRDAGETGKAVSQEMFDAMFSDFDAALREMGTGDTSVGKKMRKLGEAFYGRAKAYDAALEEDEIEPLVDALARNLTGQADDGARRIAEWVRAADAALAAQGGEKLAAGERPDFTEPA